MVAASLFARDERSARIRQLFEGSVHAISVVTIGEMRSAAIRSRWGDHRRRELEDHLAGYLIVPIDSAVADEWARLRARCLDLGRPKRDNDLWIAATARRLRMPLATLDAGMHDIPGLTVVRADGTEIAVPE